MHAAELADRHVAMHEAIGGDQRRVVVTKHGFSEGTQPAGQRYAAAFPFSNRLAACEHADHWRQHLGILFLSVNIVIVSCCC
jgi:hypothetical protein